MKKQKSEINNTFSPAFVRHTQVLCFPLVEHQPSDHLFFSPPSSLSPSRGFLQLAGAIRLTGTVQRRARQRGRGARRQGARLPLPRLQQDGLLADRAGCRGRACGEDTGSDPAPGCQGEQRWGPCQSLRRRRSQVPTRKEEKKPKKSVDVVRPPLISQKAN